jgi:hypothetical protein
MHVASSLCLVLLVAVATGLPQFSKIRNNQQDDDREDEEPKAGTHPATSSEEEDSAEHQNQEKDEQRNKEQVVQVCSDGENATCSCPNGRSPPCLPFQKASCSCADGSTPSAHLILPPLPVAPVVPPQAGGAAASHPTCSNGQLARCGIFCANGATPPCVIGNEPTCTCLDGSTPTRHVNKEAEEEKEGHNVGGDDEEHESGNKTHPLVGINKPGRPFHNNSTGFQPGQHTKPFGDKNINNSNNDDNNENAENAESSENEAQPPRRPVEEEKEVEEGDHQNSSTARSAERIPPAFPRLPQQQAQREETEEQKLQKRRQPQQAAPADEEEGNSNNSRNDDD